MQHATFKVISELSIDEINEIESMAKVELGEGIGMVTCVATPQQIEAIRSYLADNLEEVVIAADHDLKAKELDKVMIDLRKLLQKGELSKEEEAELEKLQKLQGELFNELYSVEKLKSSVQATADKKYTLKDKETGQIVHWTVKQILEELNEDRSDEWTPYDESDWQEGLAEFGDPWELLGEMEVKSEVETSVKIVANHKELLEKLADLEHEQWMHWSKAVADQVSEDKKKSWEENWVPYDGLTESVKEMDREWAEKVLEIVKPYLKDEEAAEEVDDITPAEVGANVEAAGEADQDYDHESFDLICGALAKAGYDCEHKEFDKYQGVYLSVSKAGKHIGKFWVADYYVSGDKKESSAKYRSAKLIDSEGDEYSATAGDYFQLNADHVFEDHTLVLVDKQGKETVIENPKKSDLPDLLDVDNTIQFKGTPNDHYIFQEEKTEMMCEVVIDNSSGKPVADVSEMLGCLGELEAGLVESITVEAADKLKRKDGSSSKRGLWDNIRAKQKRGEKPRKPVSEGAPTKEAWEKAQASLEEGHAALLKKLNDLMAETSQDVAEIDAYAAELKAMSLPQLVREAEEVGFDFEDIADCIGHDEAKKIMSNLITAEETEEVKEAPVTFSFDDDEVLVQELLSHFISLQAEDEEIAEMREEIKDSLERESDGTIRFTAGGDEYVGIKSEDEAEAMAVEQVENDLSDDPELFNPTFIEQHIYITDTDRRIIAGEEADARLDGLKSRELVELAKEYGLDFDEDAEDFDADDLKEDIHEKIYDEVYEKLQDPVDYFCNELGAYTPKDLLKQSFIGIDTEEAAKEAVRLDGWEHFLSRYDGNYDTTKHGVVVFLDT